MRLKLFIFVLVSVVAINVLSEKVASNRAARAFGNLTYFFGNEYGAEAAALINGVYKEPYLNVRYGNRYVYADLNHDGLKDAAVIVIENNGGNTDWYTLAFLINDGEKLVHKASRILDHSAIINSMLKKNDKVLIDMFVHQEGDCQAGPTKRVKTVYEYKGPDAWIDGARMKLRCQSSTFDIAPSG